MTIEFTFQPWEHFRALRAITRNSRGWWVYFTGLVGIPIAGLGFIVLGQVSGPQATGLDVGRFWYLLLTPATVLVVVPCIHLWQAFSQQRATAAKRGLQERTLSDDGLVVRSAAVAIELRWPAMVRVIETPEFFLFYPTPLFAYYVPKRALSEIGIIDEVRQLVLQHGPSKSRLLASTNAAV